MYLCGLSAPRWNKLNHRIRNVGRPNYAMLNRAVFTLAVGKRSYFAMAMNLARSFERWNGSNDLRFFIVTDLELPIPKDLKRSALIKMESRRLPRGFSAKLLLDQLQPAKKSLFLDADC